MSKENAARAKPTPLPEQIESQGLVQSLLRFSVEKPVEAITALGAVIAGLHTTFYGLGLIALASREQLLGLDTSLDYPVQKVLLTSLHVLWTLPWNMILAFSTLRWAALLIIFCVFGPALLHTFSVHRKKKWLFIVTHWLFLLLTFACVSIFSTAVRPDLADGRPAPYFNSEVNPALGGVARAEVVSWLTNDHPDHEARRQGMFGLVGWVLVFFAMILQHLHWLKSKAPELGGDGIRLFRICFIFLALAALPLLPKAYAVAYWGIEYPRVQLSGSGCCTYDVSAGGSPITTLQVGENCKDGSGFRTWTPEKAQELLIGVKEVIHENCK